MSFGNILYTIILYPLIQIIEIAFFLFNKLFDNSGIAVIGVSLTVTLLCLPLYIVAEHWQQVERDTQSKLKPGIDRIKSVFKGDEQYMILSTFYKQNHYHPMMALRSSFGLLIQIPFFMAAYSCLSHLPALQGQSFIFIKDMSQPDAIFYIGKLPINILPLAMTLINIIAGAIYCKGFPFKEKAQIYGMALIFLVILYDSPAGLVLYWTMNNVFSLIKNIFYKMKHPVKVLYYCMCGSILFVAIFILFLYNGGASPKKRLAAVIPLLFLIGIPLYLKVVNWILTNPLKSLLLNSKLRFKLFLFSSISLTLLTGLVLPTTLLSSSVQEFSNIGDYTTPISFIFSPLFQSFGIYIFWSFCIYFLFHEKIQTLMSTLFISLLLCSLLNVYLFTGNYGSMDITLKFIGGIEAQKKVFILVNLIVSVLIFLIPILILSTKRCNIIINIPLISMLVFLALGIFNISKINNEYDKFVISQNENNVDNSKNSKLSLSKNGKNIVIIMLDRGESLYFEHILNDNPELKNIYSGFTYYPNTVSFNGHTLMASPSLYGGYEYTPLEINKRENETLASKHNEALLIIPRVLTEQSDFIAQLYDSSWGNYSFSADMSFTKPYDKINGGILNGRYTGDFKKGLGSFDTHSLQDSTNRNLFFVSLFRQSPALIRPIVYYKGTWFSGEENSDIDSFIDGFSQLYYMNDITDFDNKNNSLIVLTNEATHSNEDISELNLINHTISPIRDKNKYLINTAAIEAIGSWLNYLKQNNVYDNTRIIVLSDHGIGINPSDIDKFDTPKVGNYLKDHLNPLLLVKDFNSKGEIKTDDTFMTNADTPVIAFENIVEKPINPFTGNLITNDAKKDGVIVTTEDLFMPHHSKSNYKFTVKNSSLFVVKDNIFKDENWIPYSN